MIGVLIGLMAIAILMLFMLPPPIVPQPYSFTRTDGYMWYKNTQKLNISFFVKPGPHFDEKYPVGSAARAEIEESIIIAYVANAKERCGDSTSMHENIRIPKPRPYIRDKRESLVSDA